MSQGPGVTRSHVGRRVVAMLASIALCAPALSAQQSVNEGTGKVDPKAVSALRSMGAYLRSMKSFGVQVKGARDEVLADGQKIMIAGSVNYLVRSPDRLRAEINTDRKQRTIYYNGKTMSLYAPRMHYYATVAAPPTVGQMLDTVRAKYGVDLPVADLFLWGTPKDGVKDLTQAKYIGPATVDGIATDQYAFRQQGTDWQIWIERGSRPLPRRLVITTVDQPAQPQYMATLMWDQSARTDDANFAFVPPKDAHKIPWGSTAVASARSAP